MFIMLHLYERLFYLTLNRTGKVTFLIQACHYKIRDRYDCLTKR